MILSYMYLFMRLQVEASASFRRHSVTRSGHNKSVKKIHSPKVELGLNFARAADVCQTEAFCSKTTRKG